MDIRRERERVSEGCRERGRGGREGGREGEEMRSSQRGG